MTSRNRSTIAAERSRRSARRRRRAWRIRRPLSSTPTSCQRMMRSPGLDSTRLVQRARAAAGEYWTYVRQFSPGARLFLAAATLGGLNSGVQSVLLNLYVLSLGYGEAFLGQMLRYG